MRMLGFYLILIGLLSIVLHFLNMNFIFLHWIDQWGPEKGWMIRGGITGLGILIWLIGKATTKKK
jgi:hypothetical protein